MKLASKIFALTALVAACSAASAQQTAPLTVTGNITPPGCTAAFANGGAFQYPDMEASSLAATGNTTLPALASTTFNITCQGAAQVAWSVVDNKSDSSYFYSSSNNQWFGLGKDASGNKIGSFAVQMTTPLLDGATAWVEVKDTPASAWRTLERAGYVLRLNGPTYTYSKTGAAGSLDKGKLFSGTINLTTVVAPKNTLNTTDAMDLKGSATINLSYL